MDKGVEGAQGTAFRSMSPVIPCSAEEARRKTPSVTNKICKNPKDRWLSPYEPEVTRSKRVGGIL